MKVFKFGAEVGASTIDPGFDGAETGVEGFRDFLIGKALLL